MTTIPVRAFKITIPVDPDSIPKGIVPPDGPAGNPTLCFGVAGTGLVVTATLNGKSLRKTLKTVAEYGPGEVFVILQGNLRADGPNGLTIIDAGIIASVKKPKPKEEATTT
jgi:hypothetical protein